MFKTIITLITFSMLLNAGTIKGTVSYAGSNKKPKTLKMDSDPVCGNSHSVPPAKEDFILDENNNFKYKFISKDILNYSKNMKEPLSFLAEYL